MSRILLVSYYYPPYLYGGSLRFKTLFTHLLMKGHDVKLIACGQKDGFEENGRIEYITDKFKRDDIKKGRELLRGMNPLPDTMLLWSLKVRNIILRDYGLYDKIIITSPPFSLPLLLSTLHNRKYLEKFVFDIRDMLYDGTLRDYRFIYPRLFDKMFEKSIFDKFINVTVNVPYYKIIIRKRYKRDSELIMNGYDTEYTGKKIKLSSPSFMYAGKTDAIRLNMTFFEGWSLFENTHDCTLYIAGKDDDGYLKKINQNGVKLLGEIDRHSCEDYISSCDICVIMNSFDIKNSLSVFPYKIIDYIKYDKPVLYVGPVTEVSAFIKKMNLGETVNSKSKNEVSEKIAKILENRENYNKISKDFEKPFLKTSFDI